MVGFDNRFRAKYGTPIEVHMMDVPNPRSARSAASRVVAVKGRGRLYRMMVVVGLAGLIISAATSGWLWSGEQQRAAATPGCQG